MVRIVIQYDMWHRRGVVNLWLNYQIWRKNVYNVGNNFVSVSELETLYLNINEARNCNLYPHLCFEKVFPVLKLTQNCYLYYKSFLHCKIFLWLSCLSPDPPAIYSMKRITLANQGLALFGFFPICNMISPIIDQCRYFFYFFDKALILKHSLTLSNANTYIWSKKRVWVLQFLKYETKTYLAL